jgi:hypothetical protein
MVASLEIAHALKRPVEGAEFVATGQTGIMVSGQRSDRPRDQRLRGGAIEE